MGLELSGGLGGLLDRLPVAMLGQSSPLTLAQPTISKHWRIKTQPQGHITADSPASKGRCQPWLVYPLIRD